ncbi:CRAL-TRIO domain-containing protein [Abortiporus biennis]|nr:CRAL-TRIO domain-containing protein [Abortiporus biennis]
MSIRTTLEEQIEALHTMYERNLEAVRILQRTLSHEILPALVDEMGLNDEDVQTTQEWLKDSSTLFRVLKRHKFTSSFALESLRGTIPWRLKQLPRLDIAPPSPFIHCLPSNVHDPFGRPIVVLKLSRINDGTVDLRTAVLRNVELLRQHLINVNKMCDRHHDDGFRPKLQCVALLDIKGMSLNSMQNIDLLGWYMSEVLPRFPGLVAAVFVLNYSWAHSGLWNVAKRALPASALSKVFFPSQSELTEYFSAASLPRDYGGELPYLSELEDPLHAYIRAASVHTIRRPLSGPSPSAPISTSPVTEKPAELAPEPPLPEPTLRHISPTSILNPFFGYPVYYTTDSKSSTPTLHHGRRRKRDLLRTLATLWWLRWRKQISAVGVVVAVTILVVVARKIPWRMWRWRWNNFFAGIPALGVILAQSSTSFSGVFLPVTNALVAA